MTYAPLLKQPLPVPEGLQLRWSVTGANNSGLFTLRAVCANTSVPLTLESRVISRTLVQEITRIEVRGRPVSEVGAIFFREELAEFKLTFEPGMQGLAVLLEDTDAPVGMVYVPALRQLTDVPQGLTLSWNVTGGKVSGSFALKLGCAGVTTALTLTSRVMSKLTSDAFESITLNGETIDDLSKPDLVFFRAGTHVLELKPKSGGPLPEMKVALIAGDINPNLGITYTPPLGESNTQDIPENGSVKWTIIGGSQSGFFDLQFKFTETDEVFPLPCRVLSKNLNDEATAILEGNDDFFLRGIPRTLKLTAKPGSPLDGYPVTLTCAIKSGLDVANVGSNPIFGLDNTTNSWAVTGSTKSGTFQLSLTGKGMTAPIALTVSKLLSTNLNDEADVTIDTKPVPPEGNFFLRGQAQTVKLTPKANSPLAGYPVTLTCAIKSGLVAANVVSVPAFDAEKTTHSWDVTGSTKSGTFQLSLTGKDMTTPIVLNASKLLSTNLNDEADVKIGGALVPADGNFFLRGQAQTVMLTPKANSPLAGYPVTLTCAIKSGLDVANVGSNPIFGLDNTTHSWAVTGSTKSGTFQLSLTGKGMTAPIALTVSKLLSTNLADEVTPLLDGDIFSEKSSVFAGKPSTLSLLSKTGITGIPLELEWHTGTGVTKNDFTVTPPFDSSTTASSWSITATKNSPGTFAVTFLPQLVGMNSRITTSPINSIPYVMLKFCNQLIEPGVTVDAARNGRHSIRLLEGDGDTPYTGARVKIELEGASSIGKLSPDFGTWMSMSSTSEWLLDCDDKDANFSLKFIFENTPTHQFIAPFSLTNHPRTIKSMTPDRDKFIAHELGYYNVFVTSARNTEIPMRVEIFYFNYFGVPFGVGPIDYDGRGQVPINYIAGQYTLTCFMRSPNNDKEGEKSAPLVVYPAQ
ncbi:hypothetical protein BK659_06645 [Pseudomonas brassicacearum]|uniref:Uncharacterized protein n=1 Tax=Pseudomonas brassicacearum TaxID=930166 RepID=A0A423HBG1_9PSED|nr:hypothetical protein [Pseudomonas brassicacearum]RON10417.1 hypothetical protein BK659_06645 [Pseudomonas brassicacearum]